MQGGKELSAQRRVECPGTVRLHHLEAARSRVGTRGDLFGDRDLAGGPQQGERAGGTESDAGNQRADLLPQLAGAQGGGEFVVGAAGNPDQSEVAHGGPARLGFALEVGDVMAALHRLERVGGAEDAAADDRHTHGR